jgi:general secretion pathway protein G
MNPSTRTKPIRRRRRGFSLIELTLVLAIIGALMAVAVISIAGTGSRAKKRTTQASMTTIKSALSSYHLEHSSYPPDLRTLITTKFLEDKKLKDGWDNDFVYDPRGRNTDQPFILASPGEDKTMGNEDDIDVWTMDK